MHKIYKLIKSNWKTILFYLLVFFAFLFSYVIIHREILDCYWNYGVAYNLSNGMLPYRDFNLLTLPFAPMLISVFLNLFSKKMIVFFIFNSLCMTLTVYLASKLEKTTTMIVLFVLIYFGGTSYNSVMVLLMMILLLLEKKEKNDYLVGVIVALAILTKQVLVVLLIPMLIGKDKNRIIKRIIGLIIPAQFFLAYLVKNDIFLDCLDYALFGMFDFGGNNSNFSINTFLAIIAFGYLIYKYLKTKNVLFIYSAFFMIIAVPIFDNFHFLYACIPLIVMTCGVTKKEERIINSIFISFILLFLTIASYREISNKKVYFELDKKSNYFLIFQNETANLYSNDVAKYYYDNIDEYNIYFLDDSIYYVKLKYDIPINKFDMVLYGNNGYDGNNKLKKEIKNMKEKTLFLVDERALENRKKGADYIQTNYDLIEFVINNYEKVDSLEPGYNVYEIVNG